MGGVVPNQRAVKSEGRSEMLGTRNVAELNPLVLDPLDFHAALATEFEGAFRHVAFAITDWSPERKFLRPFSEAFSSPA